MENRKYTVAIVDDDKTATKSLKEALEQESDFEVVTTADNYKRGIQKILSKRPDLLFLDVELPDGYGYDLLEEIRDRITWKMMVVFYSAYDSYMIQAIRQSAFDYLLKPFDPTELSNILNRFRGKFQNEKINIPSFPKNGDEEFFIVSTSTGMKKIHYNEIGYFEYDPSKRAWQIISIYKSRLYLKTSTKSEDLTQASKNFFKISKKHIINMTYFSTIDNETCLLTDPFNEDQLPVTHGAIKEMQERYGII